MDSLMEISIEVTDWLQTNYPQLEPLSQALAAMGRFEFYSAVISLIFWCFSKRWGIIIAYVLTFSNMINATLKQAFRDPRPYWIEPSIGLAEEENYGFSSGHAQNATVFYLLLAAWLSSGWIWLLAIVMVILAGFSRIYLGVHDIPDVAGGILLGLVILAGAYLWKRYAAANFNNRILGQRLLTVISVVVIMGVIYATMRLLIGSPDYNVSWQSFIDAAERASSRDAARGLGGLIGVSIGFILEGSRVRFTVDGPVLRRVVRYLFGSVVSFGLYFGLRAVVPDDPLWLQLPVLALQAFLVTLWVTYYGPMMFVRLKLADAKPEPDVTIRI